MQLPQPLQTNGCQRIALLTVAKWLAFPGLPVLGWVSIHRVLPLVLWCVVCVGLFFALRAWEDSRRRQFIREARMPNFPGAKLRLKYPQLSTGDADLVLRGLRRTWYWTCKEESINPRTPGRHPLLFALDKKFAVPGGFSYVPDCRDIDRASGSGDYCGTSFGSSGGDSGGCGGGCGGN